jgi:acyl-CoA synthetase
MERHGVTFLACVTTQMMMMLGSPTFPERDLGPLRTVFTGGEAVSAEAAARFEASTDAHVLQFYGSNENGAISVTRHDDPDAGRLGTAGRPIPAMRVRLYDGERDVTAGSGPGQVASRGPTGCLGYYADPEANAELLNRDGWMLSGDLGTIGADGFLRLTGRVCLCVELVPGAELTLEALCDHMTAAGVSREWLPERLLVLDAMPRSAGEKIDKRRLREMAKD